MKLAHAAFGLAALCLAPACSDSHAAGSQGGHEPAGHAAVPSEGEIAALFDRWNATIQNGGPHDVALLYAEDGVLLPTVSNEARSNRAEIADYFEHFLQLQPRGVINEQFIQVLDENTAVNSGIYTFDVVKEGVPTYVVARYSFVYERIDGRWQIKSHHSSAMPEAVAARPQTLAQRARHAQTAEADHAAPEQAAHDDHAEAAHADAAHAEPAHATGH